MQSGFSTRYQFQPSRAGRVIGIALGILAVLFIPTTVVGLTSFGRAPSTEPVSLSSAMSEDVDKPVLIDGQPLECAPYLESTLLHGYACDGAYIESIIHDAQDDPELTLRRMVRAGSMGFADHEAPVEEYGDTLVLVDGSYGMLGFLTPVENEQLLYAQVNIVSENERTGQLLDATWAAAHDEPLPAGLAGELRGAPAQQELED